MRVLSAALFGGAAAAAAAVAVTGAAPGLGQHAPTTAAPVPVQVKTVQGVVEGMSSPSGNYFLGMRYATPPLGDLRWRRPVPLQNWTGVHKATAYGADCFQYRAAGAGGRMIGGWYTINGLEHVSEDCLFVNVVTPPPNSSSTPPAPWPVMVYFHAGEFYMGAGNDLENNWPYDAQASKPSAIAQHGVVVVTLNYRLGNLGFLAADELRSRDPAGSTGNYGIQDQREALRWVQQNIGFFGGDPNNVVLAGESSGGTGVAAHLIMRESWGLFHRVIMQSPGFTQIKPWDRAYLDAKYLMAQMSLPATAGPNCQMTPFGGDFDTPGAWVEYPMPLHGGIYLSGVYPSVRDAVNACNANFTCMGVQYFNNTNATTITASFSKLYQLKPLYTPSPAPAPKLWKPAPASPQARGSALGGGDGFAGPAGGAGAVPDVARTGRGQCTEGGAVDGQRHPQRTISTFLRAPNMSLFVDCLMGQTAQFLADNFDGPFEDTIFENLFGPVPDGVEFNGSLVSNLLDNPLPPNITYLVGSNLDEGTEFIGITAPVHPCNMTNDTLASWAYQTFKNIDSIADNMSSTYASIQMPVPSCQGSLNPYPADRNHVVATRAVADGTFLCLVQALADRLMVASPLAAEGAQVYNYFWTHRPLKSLNMKNLEYMGAFHGSEVPFVFGYPAEIQPEEEALAASLSCYWANFAHTGDPNSGPCNNTLLAPVAWEPYRAAGGNASAPARTLVLATPTNTTPTATTHMETDVRRDVCGLFRPLWNGTVRPSDGRAGAARDEWGAGLPVRSRRGSYYAASS